MKLLDSSHLSLLTEIRDIYRSLPDSEDFGLLWSDNLLMESLKSQEVFGFFDEGGDLKSFLIVKKVSADVHEIHMMMTHPEIVRRGFMAQLFQAWLQTCPRPWEVWLEVHEKNLAAIRFYEKQGFLLDSHRANYYPDGGAALLYSLRCN